MKENKDNMNNISYFFIFCKICERVIFHLYFLFIFLIIHIMPFQKYVKLYCDSLKCNSKFNSFKYGFMKSEKIFLHMYIYII